MSTEAFEKYATKDGMAVYQTHIRIAWAVDDEWATLKADIDALLSDFLESFGDKTEVTADFVMHGTWVHSQVLG